MSLLFTGEEKYLSSIYFLRRMLSIRLTEVKARMIVPYAARRSDFFSGRVKDGIIQNVVINFL